MSEWVQRAGGYLRTFTAIKLRFHKANPLKTKKLYTKARGKAEIPGGTFHNFATILSFQWIRRFLPGLFFENTPGPDKGRNGVMEKSYLNPPQPLPLHY